MEDEAAIAAAIALAESELWHFLEYDLAPMGKLLQRSAALAQSSDVMKERLAWAMKAKAERLRVGAMAEPQQGSEATDGDSSPGEARGDEALLPRIDSSLLDREGSYSPVRQDSSSSLLAATGLQEGFDGGVGRMEDWQQEAAHEIRIANQRRTMRLRARCGRVQGGGPKQPDGSNQHTSEGKAAQGKKKGRPSSKASTGSGATGSCGKASVAVSQQHEGAHVGVAAEGACSTPSIGVEAEAVSESKYDRVLESRILQLTPDEFPPPPAARRCPAMPATMS